MKYFNRLDSVIRLAAVVAAMVLLSPAVAVSMDVAIVDRAIRFNVALPIDTRTVELEIHSSRNDSITRFTTLAPNDPDAARRRKKYAALSDDTWYPIIDVRIERGMTAICQFDGSLDGGYTFGGPYFNDTKPLAKEVSIPPGRLEQWENSVRIPRQTQLTTFYTKKVYATPLNVFRHSVDLLSEDWSGTVRMFALDNNNRTLIGQKRLSTTPDTELGLELKQWQGKGITRDRLLAALKASIEDGLRRQNTDPDSPTCGSFFTFYDLEARTHRTSYWLWGGSPLVKMMMDSLRYPEIQSAFSRDRLIHAAELTGQLYLNSQVREEGHPSRGSFLVIWTRSPAGYKKWVGTSDSGIMHRWVTIPLYRATGKQEYLESAKFWCEEKGKLLSKHEILPHFFLYDQGKFNDSILDETGWDPEGHAALYSITGEERHRRIAKDYMSKHMAKFQNENGLWNRNHIISRGESSPPSRMTRGTGWAMEGLLAMNEMFPDAEYLKHAKQMATHLLKHQRSDGAWNFVFDAKTDSGYDVPSDKATPLWSFLMYRLYLATNDDRYLASARRALAWCLDHQYTGPDPEAIGGLVGRTNASMVGYRHYFPATCAYATGFFGLAILEELKLSESLRNQP